MSVSVFSMLIPLLFPSNSILFFMYSIIFRRSFWYFLFIDLCSKIAEVINREITTIAIEDMIIATFAMSIIVSIKIGCVVLNNAIMQPLYFLGSLSSYPVKLSFCIYPVAPE